MRDLLKVVVVLLGLLSVVCADFQSRHLLEESDPFIEASAESSASGMGAGPERASISLGSEATTSASSVIDLETGVEENTASAYTGADIGIDQPYTYSPVMSMSFADTTIANSVTGRDEITGSGYEIADGSVDVASDATAIGMEGADTSASAGVVLMEGQASEYGSNGIFTAGNAVGEATAVTDGDSEIDTSVTGMLSLMAKEEKNNVATEGQFGYALAELDAQAETMGDAVGFIGSTEEIDSMSALSIYGGTLAGVESGIATANAGGEIMDMTTVSGHFSNTESDGILDTTSFATDNTLKPELGFPTTNGEDAKAITTQSVEASGTAVEASGSDLSTGTALMAGSRATSMTDALLFMSAGDDGSLVYGGIQDATTMASGGGSVRGYAASDEFQGVDNQVVATMDVYVVASSEAVQSEIGDSFDEGLSEVFVGGLAESEDGVEGDQLVGISGRGSAQATTKSEYVTVDDEDIDQEVVVQNTAITMGFINSNAVGGEYNNADVNVKSIAGGAAFNTYFDEEGVNGATADGQHTTEIEGTSSGTSVDTGDLASASANGGLESSQKVVGTTMNNAETWMSTQDINNQAYLSASGVGTEDTVVKGEVNTFMLNLNSGNVYGSGGPSEVSPVSFGGVASTEGYTEVSGNLVGMGESDDGSDSTLELSGQSVSSATTAMGTGVGAMVAGDIDLASSIVSAMGSGLGEAKTLAYSGSAGGYGMLADAGSLSAYSANVLAAEAQGGTQIAAGNNLMWFVPMASYDIALGVGSAAESEITGDGAFQPDVQGNLITASGSTNHDGYGKAQFVAGGAELGVDLGATTGAAAMRIDPFSGSMSLGYGAAEGEVMGVSKLLGMATGLNFDDSVELSFDGGASGETTTMNEVTGVSIGATAGAEGDVSSFGVIRASGDGTFGPTGVTTTSLSEGSVVGQRAMSVNGDGMESMFDADSTTIVMNMAGGPSVLAESETSASVMGDTYPVIEGTVVEGVDATGTGNSVVLGALGSVTGTTHSDSNSVIAEAGVLDLGFAAGAGLQGGAITDKTFIRPYEPEFGYDYRDIDTESLTVDSEVVGFSLTNAFSAALDVDSEDATLDGAYGGSLSMGIVLTDTEGQLKPGGLAFEASRMVESMGEEVFGASVGEDATFSVDGSASTLGFSIIDPGNPADFDIDGSIEVVSAAETEADSFAGAYTEDYKVDTLREANGGVELQAVASRGDDAGFHSDFEFSGVHTGSFSTVGEPNAGL